MSRETLAQACPRSRGGEDGPERVGGGYFKAHSFPWEGVEAAPSLLQELFIQKGGGLGRAWLGLGLRAAASPCENCLVSGQGQILSYGRARALAQSLEVSASSPLSP